MSVRVMKVLHTTDKPIVTVIAESVDEALTIDVDGISPLSELDLFDDSGDSEVMWKYILSPSGEWIPEDSSAPAIVADDSDADSDGGSEVD